MLAVISPAKRLDFDTPSTTKRFSDPQFEAESKELIGVLRKKPPQELSQLMSISDNLAELNSRRYAAWEPPSGAADRKQAALAFKGDVYLGLAAWEFDTRDLTWAQKHVRILSGLHGVLRPLDAILPYRLEMGTRLATRRGSNLYEFWGGKVTAALDEALDTLGQRTLINLASNEYFGVVDASALSARVINVQFKQLHNGRYKFLSFPAKKARGSMAAYMVKNRIKTLKALKAFDWDGYAFSTEHSQGDDWVFLRDNATDYRG